MSEMSKPAIFSVDGIRQAYVTKCKSRTVSNDHEVNTLALGLTGFSDGAEMVQVDFSAAIPLAGRELDYKDRCAQHRTTTITVRMGGKAQTITGRFLNVEESSDVNSPNGLDGSFAGYIVSNQ